MEKNIRKKILIKYIEKIQVLEHEGGHLPFEGAISNHLKVGMVNRITVAVNNTLTYNTLPPGFTKTYEHPYPANYFTLVGMFVTAERYTYFYSLFLNK